MGQGFIGASAMGKNDKAEMLERAPNFLTLRPPDSPSVACGEVGLLFGCYSTPNWLQYTPMSTPG